MLPHPPSWAEHCLSAADNLALNLVSLDKWMTAMYHPSLADFHFWHHLFPFHFKVSINCLGQKLLNNEIHKMKECYSNTINTSFGNQSSKEALDQIIL